MSSELPRETVRDHGHLLARMALSAIPGFGGPALELFNRLLAPPIQRRRDAWFNELAKRLDKLEQEGRLKIEDLVSDDQFITTVMQASISAVRNHQHEKIEALRNAVLNTAAGQSLDDLRRELFLGFVDVFTVRHLQLLQAIFEHERSGKHNLQVKTSIESITELGKSLIPELRKEPFLAEIVVDDLCRKGLLFWNRERGVVYVKGGTTQVTDVGHEFWRFISEPKDRRTEKML